VLTITAEGLAAYQAWIDQFTPELMLTPHEPWLLRLVLAEQENIAATRQLLEQYRLGCLQKFQSLSAAAEENLARQPEWNLYFKLGAEYRKQQYLAGIRWADYALRILKELE
jgi:hypothetical protein